MKITVEYAAQVKRAAGVSGDTLELGAGATLADVVAEIAGKRGDVLTGSLLTDDAAIHPSILTFVGDQQVRDAAGHAMSDGDVVTFLSPISGG